MLPDQALSVKQIHLAIKLWWPGYDPEDAFDVFTAPDVKIEARTADPTLRRWQPSAASVEEVRDFMLERGLRILDTRRVSQRRNGRWEGLYIITIGKELTQ